MLKIWQSNPEFLSNNIFILQFTLLLYFSQRKSYRTCVTIPEKCKSLKCSTAAAMSPDELTSKIQQILFEYILGITLKLIQFTVFNFNMETCFITAVDTNVCCVISVQFYPIYLLFVTKHKSLVFTFLKAFIWMLIWK